MLIGITGPAGVGKSTVAEYLVQHHEFTRLRFAAPLKAMLRALLAEAGVTHPATVERIVEGDHKGLPLTELNMRNARHAMQTLGTEWGRECMGHDFWITLAECRLKATDGPIVFDDVRFENEAHMIRRQGGVIVHLTGRGGIPGNHASEAGVSIETGDITLRNDGDTADLDVSVEKLVQILTEPASRT